MRKHFNLFSQYLIGVLFGLGLMTSGMTNPEKIINFLNITGLWDPSLLFVMVGAVLVAMAGSIVTMAASTGIYRQVNVGFNNVSGQIQSTSGGYIGYTLDIAINPGDIVRVFIQPLLSA